MVGRNVVVSRVVVDVVVDDVVDDDVVDGGCVVVDGGVLVADNAGVVVLFCAGIVAGAVVVLVTLSFLYLQSHIQYVDSLASLPS